jgi:UDP-N-acetylglucosamine 2-epimerase (non-hydrolysing)
MHLLCVGGARPNFVKLAPVVQELERRSARVTLVHTGQHYDRVMSEVFFEDLGLRAPDHHLGVGSASHAGQVAGVMVALEPLIDELRPDVVVVVGDVNSTVACGLVAAKAGPLLAHVEAGLRSRDWSMPEEVNRVVVDRLSDLLFAPSADAVENLMAEGARVDQVHLVGNVMVDALLSAVDGARARSTLDDLGLEAGGYALVTLHRPANVDHPPTLKGILHALARLAELLPVVLPAHPRTRQSLMSHSISPAVRVIEPQGYLDFIALESGARLVLTDSGGVQEETTVLGVPCLTLRENTERPITLLEGTNRLVGRDPETIVQAARHVLANGVQIRRPELWDGRASERICDVLLNIDTSRHPRPTAVRS